MIHIILLKLKKYKNELFLVLILTFIQTSLHLISNYIFVGRPYFNTDYIFIILLAVVAPRAITLILLILAVLIDCFMMLVQILPFTRFNDFIYFLGRSEFLNDEYLVIGVTLLILASLTSYFVTKLSRSSNKLFIITLFNLFITSSIASSKLVAESSEDRFYRVVTKRFSDSVFLYAYNYRSSGFVSSSNIKNQEFFSVNSERAIYNNIKNTDKSREKILFILNESWGIYKNNSIHEKIISPIKDINHLSGHLDFQGLTVSAELKELCGLGTDSLFLKNTKEKSFKHCIPNKLKADGYKTKSYHGAGSMMYDRYHWYPLAGFEESLFFDSQEWPKRCFSFPGACDSDIAEIIRKDINSTDKGFFYWLTLNTHHNYNLKDLKSPSFDCKKNQITNSEVCRNAKLQNQFFETVSNLINNINDKTTIIIVGDHTPPITLQEDKENYFETGKVPWLVIEVESKNKS